MVALRIGPSRRQSSGLPRRSIAAVVAVLMLVAAGCGSDGSATDDADLLGTRLEPNAPQVFLDVITAELDAGEDVALCMKGHGFDYVGYPYSREQTLLPEMAETFADPDVFARTRGYGITRPELMGPDPDDVLAPIDPDYEVALYGRPVSEMAQDGQPPRGCWGEHAEPAFEQIAIFVTGRDALNELIDADSEVEATRAMWARCMAEHGYSYYSPPEALRHFNEANSQLMFSSGPDHPIDAGEFDELLDEEIATAMTDQLDCGGAELRHQRLEVGNRIGLDPQAADALEQFASRLATPDPFY